MTNRIRYDPLIHSSKTVFLQRLQDAAIGGYRYYTCGSIPLQKAPGLVRKFKEFYLVDLDKFGRFRRKAQGLGNARLFLRQAEDSVLDFFLMVSPGEHPAHQLEKLQDIRSKPLTYREFELLLLTRKGYAKPGLTWRLSAETMEGWRHRLHLCTAHYNRMELRQAWHSLYRVPGFSGVRRQVGELVVFWRSEWKRHRGDAPCPMAYPHNDMRHWARPGVVEDEAGNYSTRKGFPTSQQLPKLFYVRRAADAGARLSSLVSTHRQRIGPIAQAASQAGCDT